MSLVRDPQSSIIAQFSVPVRGTWNSVAINTVPTDAVYIGINIFIRRGKLRSRPGFVKLKNTVFLESVIGGTMVTVPGGTYVLAITPNYLYKFDTGAEVWTSKYIDEMEYNYSKSNDTITDIALLETSGKVTAIIAREGVPLKQWIPIPESVSIITGTNIPLAKSVCISASRVVALIPPHTLVWSATSNPASFDPTAYAKRAQTGDLGVCVRSLSALAFVLYKERSIHLARAQSGLDDSTAFAFQEPLYVEGPAGIHAVVNVAGTHIYMTRNGRIAMFDGTSYPRWIADGLWLALQDDIELSRAGSIRGVYDYRLHTVTFFYPKKNELGPLRGMVIINLPFEGLDIAEPPTPRSFIGISTKLVTHACEMRFDRGIDRSLIFAAPLTSQQRYNAFIMDEESSTDDGEVFQCLFQTGMVAMPDAAHTSVTVETFAERGLNYGSVIIEPVISDSLEQEAGIIIAGSHQYIDLETTPIREYKGFGRQVRFFGLRYRWDSSNRFRYSGTVVYKSDVSKFKR